MRASRVYLFVCLPVKEEGTWGGSGSEASSCSYWELVFLVLAQVLCGDQPIF